VQRHIAANRISGAIALVARKGRVVYFEATGLMDIKLKKPMRKDALFVLASMTKPVTGVAVMMLMEEGKRGQNPSDGPGLDVHSGVQGDEGRRSA
jgi:CubicO group peptidase (beta-lactamase class C family)